jgi:hypothetical protein
LQFWQITMQWKCKNKKESIPYDANDLGYSV